jgi:hypothetical protein
MKKHHYTYKITFEDTPFYYYGLHSTEKLDDGYLGSPKTNRWCWDFYEATSTILEFFETREEAFTIENILIKTFINDPYCLNAHTNASFSIQASSLGAKAQPRETKQANGRKLAEFNRENKTGGQSMPLERQQELMRQNGAKLTITQRKLNAAIQHSQLWRCLVTNYETTPGPLSRYQNARGIDTSLRVRIV